MLLLAGIATAVVLLTSGNDTVKTESEKPQVLSMTASVSIPERMTFAGEEILFDRYDKRERMDRELNSFTYFHSTTMLLIKRANRIFPIIEPILKREGVPDDMKYLAVIPITIAVSAVSMVGDLAASVLKRNHDIKDFSKLIPGHGGIMDRFDSCVFVFPTLYGIMYLLSL